MGGLSTRAYAHGGMSASVPTAGTDPNGNILVLLQLRGGNDGLNTVVPFQNDIYYKKRPALAIPKRKVLALTDDLGLHPSLKAFRDLYDNNKLTVVENVGYPNPNRSHFRATDIWLSGSDAQQVTSEGWVGRYLTKRFTQYPDTLPEHPMAIQLGADRSLLMQNTTGSMGLAFADPDAFNQLVSANQVDSRQSAPAATSAESKLFSQEAKQLSQYAGVIRKKADTGKNAVTYPATDLGRQLSIVAGLIAGGLTTPVYLTTLDGFDTHANQVVAGNTVTGQHAALLKIMADAVTAFQKDMEKQNLGQRVTVMTFSEFGRHLAQNDTLGTDHGTAAPLFVIGNSVRGGLVGKAPVLNDLDSHGDINYKNDFRQVYASVLQDHLRMDTPTARAVLGRDFAVLPIFRPQTELVNPEVAVRLAQNMPNPFVDFTEIEYLLPTAQLAKLSLFDLQGREIRVLREGHHEAGTHKVSVSGTGLTAGFYLYGLHTATSQQTLRMAKV